MRCIITQFANIADIVCSFRELCEDATPLKALSYLQTEVSAVVDHGNPEEATVFRALLSHLLLPPGSDIPAPLTRKRTREDSPIASTRPSNSEDDPMTAFSSPAGMESPPTQDAEQDSTRHSLISFAEDPDEIAPTSGNPPSAMRFRQRTTVFEQVMTFINADARQPEKDLLLMINVDQSEV